MHLFISLIKVNLYNFSKAQHRLLDDGPDGPKHVGATRDILTVCFNIL
jgi:hypothetical protein